MSASNTTLYQSSNSSTSTLRPRNARLISFIDDGVDDAVSTSITTSSGSSATPPLFPDGDSSSSQGVSRTKSLSQGRRSQSSQSHARKTSEGGPSQANIDLWSSWSSIASSLLGTDAAGSKGKGKATNKQPRWMKQDLSYASTSPIIPQWGPNESSAMSGPLEERQALAQAKKREALLMANVAENQDLTGRFKRRDSNTYVESDDQGHDALVYIHKITRDDTLAGVMLKFGCQPEVFRKVNRFWPNDNIQTRKHVFLPVEACSVRGKKVDEPDLLSSTLENLTLPNTKPQQSASGISNGEITASPTSELFHTLSRSNDDTLKHDSWVIIQSFPSPVEILRLPRKSLGYFPRARRKSLSAYTDSTTSTPKTSFDTLRHPPTHAAQLTLSLNASPVRRSLVRPSSTRQRSSSTTTATQDSFVEALRGPGGVGTLRGLRTEPSRPGPAEDALNRKFGQFFPEAQATLAPPADPLRQAYLNSARATPRASMDSVRSGRSNSGSAIGEVGGKIEGFVRKLAGGKGKTGVPGRMGDLIELETNSDLGEPILEDLEEGAAASTAFALMVPTAARDAKTRTDEDLLDERFPVRGRGVVAYGGGRDQGKDKGG